MTPNEILDAFAISSDSREFPYDAVKDARDNKEAISLASIDLLKGFLNGEFVDGSDRSVKAINALFLAIHLLGEFHENKAFPVLLRLLKNAPDEVDMVLGDATTETLSGILISTFDGDAEGLMNLISDGFVDEYVQCSAFDSLAYLTKTGAIGKEQTERFILECFDIFEIEEHGEFAWIGLINCIALLGLASMEPLVEKAIGSEWISPINMKYSDFQRFLRVTINDPEGMALFNQQRVGSFDSVDILASWPAFQPEEYPPLTRDPWKLEDRNWNLPRMVKSEPYVNPNRDIGRNDPCPCGSGKKFKKCCLS